MVCRGIYNIIFDSSKLITHVLDNRYSPTSNIFLTENSENKLQINAIVVQVIQPLTLRKLENNKIIFLNHWYL